MDINILGICSDHVISPFTPTSVVSGVNECCKSITKNDIITMFLPVGVTMGYEGTVYEPVVGGGNVNIFRIPGSGWLQCNGGTLDAGIFQKVVAVLGTTTLPNVPNQILFSGVV
jgi:hypothetical protein